MKIIFLFVVILSVNVLGERGSSSLMMSWNQTNLKDCEGEEVTTCYRRSLFEVCGCCQSRGSTNCCLFPDALSSRPPCNQGGTCCPIQKCCRGNCCNDNETCASAYGAFSGLSCRSEAQRKDDCDKCSETIADFGKKITDYVEIITKNKKLKEFLDLCQIVTVGTSAAATKYFKRGWIGILVGVIAFLGCSEKEDQAYDAVAKLICVEYCGLNWWQSPLQNNCLQESQTPGPLYNFKGTIRFNETEIEVVEAKQYLSIKYKNKGEYIATVWDKQTMYTYSSKSASWLEGIGTLNKATGCEVEESESVSFWANAASFGKFWVRSRSFGAYNFTYQDIQVPDITIEFSSYQEHFVALDDMAKAIHRELRSKCYKWPRIAAFAVFWSITLIVGITLVTYCVQRRRRHGYSRF